MKVTFDGWHRSPQPRNGFHVRRWYHVKYKLLVSIRRRDSIANARCFLHIGICTGQQPLMADNLRALLAEYVAWRLAGGVLPTK